MRISDDTRYAHPVLGQEADDFTSGEFDVRFEAEETPASGKLRLQHEIILTEAAVRELVVSGNAAVGCIVRCEDTYLTELRRLSWPKGETDFTPGSLLNRVTLRPIIWLEERIEGWDPGTLHAEFSPPVTVEKAAVIAVGPEYVMSVGQAKFQPIESIFELRRAPDLVEGRIHVDLDGDKVAILAGNQTYDGISVLRGQAQGQIILMNAIYLPTVMEVLDSLRLGVEQYEGCRWCRPFMARCDKHGIDVAAGEPIFEYAQTLLGFPARELRRLSSDSES